MLQGFSSKDASGFPATSTREETREKKEPTRLQVKKNLKQALSNPSHHRSMVALL